MYKNQLLILCWTLTTALFLYSCDDSGEDPDLCENGPELSVDNVKASLIGQSTGEIIVSASEGSGPYTYRLEGGSFQSSGTFSNLPGGTYMVEVQDSNNCLDDESVEVLKKISLAILLFI